jgi:hypothetical protein
MAVSRLIDIGAHENGAVVRDQLHANGVDQRGHRWEGISGSSEALLAAEITATPP